MKNTKLLLAVALPVIALMIATPSMSAYAAGSGATSQKFSTGLMTGYDQFGHPVSAILSGEVTTKSDGTVNLSPLSGGVIINGQSAAIQFKPLGNGLSATAGYCGTVHQFVQLGSVKTIGEGPVVKGIASIVFSTSENCGGYTSFGFEITGKTSLSYIYLEGPAPIIG